MGLIENLKSYTEGINLSSDKKELLDSFLTKGFPSIKDEEWKYTSLRKVVKNDFKIDESSFDISENEIENYSLNLVDRILFVNGNLISKPSIKGVTISNFSEGNITNNTEMSSLNSALAKKGFTI